MNVTDQPAEPQLLGEVSLDTASSELVHNLVRLAEIAVYRRKTIVQALCCAALLGTVYYALATRYYDSTAKLLIIERSADQLATVGDQPMVDNTMATHRELVTSPVVIQDAIEHLLPEHRIDFQNRPPAEWTQRIASRLSARTTRKTNFIDVSYRSVSPEAASAVVSAVIQSYLDFVERTHRDSASNAITDLSRKSDEISQGLANKRAELQTFLEQVGHVVVNTEDGISDPTIHGALQIYDGLMEAKQQRLKLEAAHASIKLARQNGQDLQQQLLALEEVVGQQILISALGLSPWDVKLMKDQEQRLLDSRNELENLSPFYGPSHPKVAELTQRIQTLEKYIATYRADTPQRLAAFGSAELGPMLEKMVAQSVSQAQARELQLEEAYQWERSKAARQGRDIMHLQGLERDVERLEFQNDSLLEKIASVDLRQLQAPIQATVVAEPLPDDAPDSPELRLIVVASLMGGLIAGGIVAYVQDVLDDRFVSPEEMTAQLRVPVLAMVERLEALAGDGLAAVHTFAAPNAVATEAFRTLRTALALRAGPTDRIAISSAEPSDGKTTVAANLAVSFAQAGKRTLIIDADLRKPGLTAMMGLKGQPGVSDILSSGDAPQLAAPQWVHQTEQPGLDVLPSGLRRPDPAELLSGRNFVELLAWADSCYDQVLVDSPPVLAVSDAQIIGRLVDGAVLVVQPQKNHRRLVARACGNFTTTGTAVLGIVANALTADSAAGYRYGYGYGYGNGYGHREHSEPDTQTLDSESSMNGLDSEHDEPVKLYQAPEDAVVDAEVKETVMASEPKARRAA